MKNSELEAAIAALDARLRSIEDHNARHCKTCAWEHHRILAQRAAVHNEAQLGAVQQRHEALAVALAASDRFIAITYGPNTVGPNGQPYSAINLPRDVRLSPGRDHTMRAIDWEAWLKSDEFVQAKLDQGVIAIRELSAEEHLKFARQTVGDMGPTAQLKLAHQLGLDKGKAA